VTVILLLLVKVSTAALILSIGMGARIADILYLWRRPVLLVRSLLAMYFLVPAAAYLIVLVWPLGPAVKAALLVLAVSAGAPLLPRKLESFGSGKYAFSLVVTTSLLAIVVVPAWVALLARHFDVAAQISSAEAATAIAKAFLLPLAAGMTLGAVLPWLTERYVGRAVTIAGLALTLASLALLVTHWRILFNLHWNGMVALVVLMLIAVAVGHVCGGPKSGDRTVLAISCATRHIGIAVVVATTFQGPRTVVILAAYVIASALVSIPYLHWRRRSASVVAPASAESKA
jgi:bile acid:Na+ symporter, BASS family